MTHSRTEIKLHIQGSKHFLSFEPLTITNGGNLRKEKKKKQIVTLVMFSALLVVSLINVSDLIQATSDQCRDGVGFVIKDADFRSLRNGIGAAKG